MQVRVLIVDDERGIADTLREILNGSGYEARAAYSAQEALAILPGFHPNLVISDVVMPGKTGVELAFELHTSSPHLPVVLLSGNAATDELLAAYRGRLGRLLVLAKPFAPRELLRVVAKLTRKAA